MNKAILKKVTVCLVSLFMFSSLIGCNTGETSTGESETVENDGTEVNEILDEDETETGDEPISGNTDSTSDENDTPAEIVDQPAEEEAEVVDPLTLTQKNSVAMLNYLAAISQKIEETKNNRVYLEQVYSSLINNTNPDKIDKTTQDHLTNMLDIIEDYRMISIKRDRLQYLYEMDKAATIKKAVPNPLAVLSVANALDWKRLVATVVYTAIDSYNNYKNANDELDKQFMISGWDLDDNEAENIHKNRKRAFNYMVNIVRENNLPGNLALSEAAIEQYTKYVNTENVYQKLQFLESEQATYIQFGSYWLELADCYYELEDYSSCLDCFDRYDDIYTEIFRKDYSYAELLPKAIVAAQNEYKDSDRYVDIIGKYTDSLVKNTENTDWALRYFAAQSYMDLYTNSGDEDYLRKAYTIVLDNVNQLIDTQKSVNQTYLNDVKELILPDAKDMRNASDKDKKEAEKRRKEEQKNLEKYNKSLKEKRKTECPSLYEPLVLNCDLLFSLAEKLNISDKEKKNIEGMLQTDTNGVFISKPINDMYSFFSKDNSYTVELKKDEIKIPVELLTEDAVVVVSITDSKGTTVFTDTEVTKVDRKGKDISTFVAYVSSKKLKSFKWSAEAKVEISISYGENYEPLKTNFKVAEYKDNSILPDKVEFECID